MLTSLWCLGMVKIVCVSGGFDPAHRGHMDYIRSAAELGDVVVILNSDDWLKRKKGYTFMAWEDRAAVLREVKGVMDVVTVDDSDGTVCQALEQIRPDIFANGGDRFKDNVPEKQLCERLGIEMMFNVGGGKVASSSEIVEKVRHGN